MKLLIATVLIAAVVLVLAFVVRLGGFKDVKLADEELGPLRTVAKVHVGAYHKAVPVIVEVETWAHNNGENCRLSVGEFLDDVETVPEDRLRSNGGCVVEKNWEASGPPPDSGPSPGPSTRLPALPEGFSYREIPRRRYVTAEFEGAPSIGPLKVYPKARRRIEEQGLVPDGPVIELYEVLPGEKVRTKYLFPVREAKTRSPSR